MIFSVYVQYSHHVECSLPPVIHPISLDVGDEQLIDTFDVVETLCGDPLIFCDFCGGARAHS